MSLAWLRVILGVAVRTGRRSQTLCRSRLRPWRNSVRNLWDVPTAHKPRGRDTLRGQELGVRGGWVGRIAAFAAAVMLGAPSGAVDTSIPARHARVAGVVYDRASRDGAHERPALLRPDETSVARATLANETPGELAMTPPPEVFDERPEPAPPPPAALQRGRFAGVKPEGGTWAVTVGINNYPGSRSDLRSAVADAEDVNSALAQLGVPAERRVVLRDERATADTVRTALDWLVAHAGPDATVVFFYAGHIRSLGGGTEAIVAADGGTITDDEVAQRLSTLQARRAWIGLAACYAGGFTEVLASGRVLTAAAAENSLAYENESHGRSYLVEYMIRRAVIERRADSSVEAAFRYAEAELRRDYPNRVPVQFDNADGELDLRPPSSSTSPAPASPPSPPPSDGSGSASSAAPTTTTTTTTTTAPETCAAMTGGIVRCGGG